MRMCLTGCLENEGSQVSLQKLRTAENMQRYLERKEERISAQKNRPPPSKKSRVG